MQGWPIHSKAGGKAEFTGAGTGGWVEVDVGDCGSSFLSAFMFCEVGAERGDGREGAESQEERTVI